jgi:hypothetical protein
VERHFKDIVHALDIWGEIEPLKISKFERNSFWFAHPVYFINHLDKTRFLNRNERVSDLKRIQDMVIALKCLEKGAMGMYNNEGASKTQTYCNHAVFLTVIATDENYYNFTDRKKTKSGEYPFPELPEDKAIEYKTKNNINSSNFWCDELRRMAAEGRLVELSPQEAQYYGNMGYTVIASYRARTDLYDVSPHFATVRPGFTIDTTLGPKIANVGANNLVGWTGSPECFGRRIYNETDENKKMKWYYNPNQEFRTDIRWIDHIKETYG